ncbi:phosphotransferase enzyme family protein [Deinococcus cellulosilyticus]|uniref:Aminoglycoside phosphotransferase n=1 Tax=Deinococcus cellulosilyticus (strain DSM 18568 / NBRC 106333 / KACC 11606 / 5516J-15) TaxID=1223518 RepID=A0A511N6H6_DEIC1|nr:phosphotransferase [Deinococcus cellulosilyticus]GEM48460.1 aminoglycoside phosphotransferase [Deinococcus cellulosilyticus NBRC 106333 = KACC 11606]
MTEFSQLTAKAQIYRLRQAAFQALKAYPFEVKRLTVLNHGFNTTFRVDDTEGNKYALRINVNSRRSIENVNAEVAWLDALARETDIPVVKPLRTRDGEILQMVQVPGMEEPVPSALFDWIPGPLLGDRKSTALFRQLGQVTAKLHQHASSWQLPEGCALPGTTSIYLGDKVVLFDQEGQDNLNDEQLQLFSTVADRAQTALDGIYARGGQTFPLHTDLHSHNIKVWKKTLQIFDFDDCAMGHPIQDIANALYYQIGFPEREAYHAAFQEGYAEVLPWTFDDAEIEALKAGRAILLANDVLKNLNPDVRKYIPRFLERTTGRMKHWLEHGSYCNPAEGTDPQ